MLNHFIETIEETTETLVSVDIRYLTVYNVYIQYILTGGLV